VGSAQSVAGMKQHGDGESIGVIKEEIEKNKRRHHAAESKMVKESGVKISASASWHR